MEAPFELTEGLERLKAILADRPSDSADWHEAENRFQFVDRLLVECLGWQKPNIRVEVSDDDGGRSDYVLGEPAKAVLEAKREARAFKSIPRGRASSVRKLASLTAASKDFAAAAAQVVPYCSLLGAQLAVICNGPQLAIFQALTPGYPPLEGECYFFDGFDEYVEHFPLLWTLLSPEGVTENKALRDLSLHRTPRVPSKASLSIPEPNRVLYRNTFQENMQSLSSLLLEVIEDNEELKSDFYRECYVPLVANNRHLLLSKSIIETRYRRAAGGSSNPGSISEITSKNSENEVTINGGSVGGTSTSKPIVVLGDVGVGKTSFFENLYENLDGAEKANTYFLNINLGISGNLSTTVKDFVLQAVPKILKQKYGVDIFSADFANAIYHVPLQEFESSVDGQLKDVDSRAYQLARIAFLNGLIAQKDAHLHASLAHLAHGRRKQIVLVIDNADQRTYDIQQAAFLIAQELAATRSVLVFVALRPSTFHESKNAGALSGYQNRTLTISPPPADEVVLKRLSFAVRVAEGKVNPAALEHVRLQLGNVVAFLNATLRSIRRNADIRTFLSNITGGNTRGVIELIGSFLGSPNVDSQKIVRLEGETGRYIVPLHEFTKHALLGDYAYYNSNSSQVAFNLFDVTMADPREHFICSLMVAYCASNAGRRDNDGFVNGDEILTEMRRHGFVDDQSRKALVRLAKARLIETPHSHYREIRNTDETEPEAFYYRSTSIGLYHTRYWAGAFSFLDAMSTDTPIFDEQAREVVSAEASSLIISSRYRKTAQFRAYLEAEWLSSGLDASYFNFSDVIKAQAPTFASVERVIGKRRAT